MLFNKSTDIVSSGTSNDRTLYSNKNEQNILGATVEMAPRTKPDKRKHAL